ncbi:hypothetical protein JN084_18130 [Mycolicibacterium austroafricanum]|nr:hypothetical protein JN084_18130 [Mycolicibacterium austroafricanum]
MGAVRAVGMLAGRPVVIALLGLGASAVVIAMPTLGGRPATTVCARWRVMAVLQT